MNEEIKEILEIMQDILIDYEDDDLTYIDEKEITVKTIRILLDYITNLQEEKQIDKYKTLKELQDRIDKAVEYNKQIIKDTKDFYRPTKDIIYSGDTLIDIAEQNINILEGEENGK